MVKTVKGKIEYSCLPGTLAAVNTSLLQECSELYSEHYGVWSDLGRKPGERIKLSEKRIIEWLNNEYANIYYATDGEKLIGYAIAFSKNETQYGIVTWVTQLVVHEKYRNQGVAKNLLFSIWGLSHHYAWGIVSANPYAIRALEKATRRRAIPCRIKKNVIKLRNVGRANVPFISDTTEFKVTPEMSMVNTEFFVDHSNTEKMLQDVIKSDIPWKLGMIEEGWEWLAFTFNDQEQISMSQDEIEEMVSTSESVVRKAYSRMNLDSGKQGWMKNTVKEIDYILNKCSVPEGSLVYDLGCGIGRHSLELGKRDFEVVGIDYIDSNIEKAKEKLIENEISKVKFVKDDCRVYENKQKAKIVLCLYDVIGSFSKMNENVKIVKTAYDLLDKGGYAVFSVMNYESTVAHAKNIFTFNKDANGLLKLPASDTMEKTGNVFNPEYYIVDEETHLVYRKEQFLTSTKLPVELIVCDRRFERKEIEEICQNVGFDIIESKYTNASDWNVEYDSTNERAKEILLICKKK